MAPIVSPKKLIYILSIIGLLGCSPNTYNSNTSYRIEENQAKLKRIVENKSVSDTRRRSAVKKITDQNFLAHVVQNDSDLYVRMTAAETITDQNHLISLAQNGTPKIQLIAATKVQYLLSKPTGQFMSNKRTPREFARHEENIAKLMLLLLDNRIIKRYGVLRLEVEYLTNERGYSEAGPATNKLYIIDYIIKIFDSDGNELISEVYKALPAQKVETFYHRDKVRKAEIDYDVILSKLLN